MVALGQIYFAVCAVLAIAGALGVVLAKNPIRSAMGLLLLILSVAGLFLALHAQFLADFTDQAGFKSFTRLAFAAGKFP